MAGPRGNAKHSVAQQLQEQPYRFTYVQAVRLIEKIHQRNIVSFRPLGGDGPPTQESLRIVGDPGLSFPSAEVIDLKGFLPDKGRLATTGNSGNSVPASGDSSPDNSDSNRSVESATIAATSPKDPSGNDQAVLTAAFMGIYGASGVLPYFDTQRIIDTGSRKNPEKDLLDLFNHRILSYFYRASIKYRAQFAYEDYINLGRKGDNLLTTILQAIAGLATSGLQNRMTFPDEVVVEFCQYFGMKAKNAISLVRMLQSYLGHPVDVRQFQGQWLTLSPDSKSFMPTRHAPLGQNCRLGQNFIVGDRVWDVQGRFRIRIGPLNRLQFDALLPGTERLVQTAQLIRLYVGVHLDFDLQLDLLAAEVPHLKLDGRSSRLGMNSWLISRTPNSNKDEAVFEHSGQPVN